MHTTVSMTKSHDIIGGLIRVCNATSKAPEAKQVNPQALSMLLKSQLTSLPFKSLYRYPKIVNKTCCAAPPPDTMLARNANQYVVSARLLAWVSVDLPADMGCHKLFSRSSSKALAWIWLLTVNARKSIHAQTKMIGILVCGGRESARIYGLRLTRLDRYQAC